MKVKKIPLIIVILLVAVIAVAVIFTFRSRIKKIDEQVSQNRDFIECQELTDAAEKQKCEESGYRSWMLGILNRAVQDKNAVLCEKIVALTDRDVCYYELTSYLPDEGLCEKVSSVSIKEECVKVLASTKSDFSGCHALTTDDDKDICFERVVSEHEDGILSFCATLPDADKVLCLDLYHTRQAVRQVDYSLCRNIENKEREEKCLSRLPRDSDGDDLSDYSEKAIHQTNPDSRDTDGDGFDDGTEVRSGNDPLKR